MKAVRKHLIHDFLEQIDESAEGLSTEVQLNPLIELIHSLRDYPVKWDQLELHSSMLSKMNTILYNMLRKSDRYSKRVGTHVLYLKEISFSYALTLHLDQLSDKDFQDKFDKFYDPLVRQSILTATESIYYLVNYHRTLDDARTYLSHNVDVLMNYLDRVQHWKQATREQRHNWTRFFGNQLLYISIFLFRKYYYYERIPVSWVNDFALRIADNAFASGGRAGSTMDDAYDEAILDSTFVYDAPFERFEDPDVETAATHIGSIYNFSHFWILLNLYRGMKKKGFLPHKPGAGNFPVLNALKDEIQTIKKEKMETILKCDRAKLDSLSEAYLDFLSNHLEVA